MFKVTSNPGPSALEADTLTTRSTWRYRERKKGGGRGGETDRQRKREGGGMVGWGWWREMAFSYNGAASLARR